MSNWKHHQDFSHPNWTASTPSSTRQPLYTQQEEKEPHWLLQVLLGVFIMGCGFVGMWGVML